MNISVKSNTCCQIHDVSRTLLSNLAKIWRLRSTWWRMIHHDDVTCHHDEGLYHGDVPCHHYDVIFMNRTHTHVCVFVYKDIGMTDCSRCKGWRHSDDEWQGVIRRHTHSHPKTFHSCSKLTRILNADHQRRIIKRKYSLIVTFNSPATSFIQYPHVFRMTFTSLLSFRPFQLEISVLIMYQAVITGY